LKLRKMAVKRISEKEFRNRRRDRRMVWVDATAFLVGLLIVTASVGGVIFYEPEQEPIEWQPVFLETRLEEYRTCAGYAGGAQQGQGCSIPVQANLHREGRELPYRFQVESANVTMVTLTLRWLDEIPATEAPCEPKYCGRNWDYNENSTAILGLRVVAPWGEEYYAEGANNWENVTSGTRQGVPSGSVAIQVPVQDIPEDTSTYKSYSQTEAVRHFNETYWAGDHKGLGEWQVFVTVVRASSMDGTFPSNPCAEAGVAEEDVPDGEENCDLYEEYEMVFVQGQGGSAGGLPSVYPGVYGVYSQALLAPVRDQLPVEYTSSYQSEGHSWTLSVVVRGWEASASIPPE
jgi:hypothetical protein